MTSSSPRCARHRPCRRISTSRSSRATTGFSGRWVAATRRAGTSRRVAPLADDFNLTADVIVGFPAEDEAAFRNTLRVVEAAGLTKVHVFPYSPRPGTRTAEDDTVPAEVKRDRSERLRALSHELCRRRWETKLGAVERILVDRPGRGYGDDYTPWLVDAEPGAFVDARARSPLRGGCPWRRLLIVSSAGSSPTATTCTLPTGSSRSATSPRKPLCTCSCCRRATSTPSVTSASFPDDEAARMLQFVAETARLSGLEDYRVIVNVGPGAGQTVFHLHWHILGGDASLARFE